MSDPYNEPLHVGYPTEEANASVDAAIADTPETHPDYEALTGEKP